MKMIIVAAGPNSAGNLKKLKAAAEKHGLQVMKSGEMVSFLFPQTKGFKRVTVLTDGTDIEVHTLLHGEKPHSEFTGADLAVTKADLIQQARYSCEEAASSKKEYLGLIKPMVKAISDLADAMGL